MPRPISSQHYEALTREWAARLRCCVWDGHGSAQEVRALARVLRVSENLLDREFIKRARIALAELAHALAGSDAGESQADQLGSLDQWIDRHLLRKGETLLISEKQRLAMLARQRDTARRSNHVDRGLRAVTIEMPGEAWARLDGLRPRLQKAVDEKVTLGKAIERLIAAYEEWSMHRSIKPSKGNAKSSRAQTETLFPPLSKRPTML